MRRGRGPLRLLVRPAPSHDLTRSVNIGFAISRKVGNAVHRNRLRRRIRAALRDISKQNPTILPPGDYLFRVTSTIEHWPPSELHSVVLQLLQSVPSTVSDSVS